MVLIGGTQYLFKKALLPETVARFVGRVCFYPFLPFSLIVVKRRGNWWDQIDETLSLGALPLDRYNHVCIFFHKEETKETNKKRRKILHIDRFPMKSTFNSTLILFFSTDII